MQGLKVQWFNPHETCLAQNSERPGSNAANAFAVFTRSL